MRDLMLDIETLGNGMKPVILSISAVQFDVSTGELGDEFEVNIDVEDAVKCGLDLDPSTVLWWMDQSNEARGRIVNRPDQVPLAKALAMFNQFVEYLEMTTGEEVRVWGRSPRFDCGRIASAMEICNMKIAWNFREERDVRTVEAFLPRVKDETPFEGIKHHGIDDAIHQIKYTHKAYSIIEKALKEEMQNA